MAEDSLRNTLKVQRAMRNLTQAELAVLAGVTRRSVNAIEAGRMVPSVFLALKLARAMSVTVETIFTLGAAAGAAADQAGAELDPGAGGATGGGSASNLLMPPRPGRLLRRRHGA